MASPANVPPPLHELEAEVMEQLWSSSSDESSVRTVMEALNAARDQDRAYTTYMTILSRLHRKGVLTRRREGKTDLYAPVLSRDEYMARRAGAEVASLVEQYGDAALSHFAQQVSQLDPKRRRALERIARGTRRGRRAD